MRPTLTYDSQGRDAFAKGKSLASCPYSEETVRHHEWRIGWIESAMQAGAVGETVGKDALEIAKQAVSDRLDAVRSLLPSMSTLFDIVGPSEKWVSNCYGVAQAILESGALQPIEDQYGQIKLTYGIYRGDVAEGSPFHGSLISRHGWLELEEGIVIDPTYWVFANVAPFVEVANIQNYDLSANQLKANNTIAAKAPAYEEAKAMQWNGESATANIVVDNLLGKQSQIDKGMISIGQLFWIANLPPDAFEGEAAEVYKTLERMGKSAFIPLDNRNYVLGSTSTAHGMR